MKYYLKNVLRIFTCFFVLLISFKASAQTGNKINIITTITPYKEFIEEVGKDLVNVSVLVPPSANPHTYDPTPSQLAEVDKAQLYIQAGSGIDFEISWGKKIVSINNNLIVVNSSKGIDFINSGLHDHENSDIQNDAFSHDHAAHGYDPHVWTSPKNVSFITENIRNSLIDLDPDNKAFYESNTINYLNELTILDNCIREKLANLKNKKIIVFHPTWGYFCRDYGLEQIPIENEGKEPTPKYIAFIIQEAKRNNIKTVFVQPQINSVTADMIAREINGKIVQVNPMAQNIDSLLIFAERIIENSNSE